jgi:hypothetical protein
MSFVLALPVLVAMHTAVSLIGLVAGILVLRGIFLSRRPGGMTALFLVSMVLTDISGFLFPLRHVGLGQVVGALSLVVLVPTILACTVHRLAGAWRWIYAVGIAVTLYLDALIAVFMLFAKVPPLRAAGPEPLFAVQGMVLALFVLVGARAVARFHPKVASGLNLVTATGNGSRLKA